MILSTLRIEVVGPGYVSYAGEGVLERVAERRVKNGWGLLEEPNTDLLVAPSDCDLLGLQGWLIVGNSIHRAAIVDCEADVHKGQMLERKLLLDTNQLHLVHKEAWLVVLR